MKEEITPEVSALIAPYIKELRQSKEYTAKDVAKAIGVYQSVVSSWENNSKKYPTRRVKQILDFLAEDDSELETIYKEVELILDGKNLIEIDFDKYKPKKLHLQAELISIRNRIDRLLESLEVE